MDKKNDRTLDIIEKLTHLTQTLGNTKASAKRKRKWLITINNWTEEEFTQMKHEFDVPGSKWIIGKEIAPTTGTPHLHGYCHWKNARSDTSLKKIFPRANLRFCRGSDIQCGKYCTKEGGETIGNFSCEDFSDKLKKLNMKRYENVKWKPWQRQVLKLENTERTIHWFWEATGDVGKSFLCKYMVLTRNIILCEGKKADIFNQVNSMLLKEKIPEVVVCDIPRQSIDYINYGVLESLKNGCLYSGKYEGGVCCFPSPLIICFANEAPDTSKMSKDRWNVVHIGPEPELEINVEIAETDDVHLLG